MRKRIERMALVGVLCIALVAGCAPNFKSFIAGGVDPDGDSWQIDAICAGSNLGTTGTGVMLTKRTPYGNCDRIIYPFGSSAGVLQQSFQGAVGNTLGGAAIGAFTFFGAREIAKAIEGPLSKSVDRAGKNISGSLTSGFKGVGSDLKGIENDLLDRFNGSVNNFLRQGHWRSR